MSAGWEGGRGELARVFTFKLKLLLLLQVILAQAAASLVFRPARFTLSSFSPPSFSRRSFESQIPLLANVIFFFEIVFQEIRKVVSETVKSLHTVLCRSDTYL